MVASMWYPCLLLYIHFLMMSCLWYYDYLLAVMVVHGAILMHANQLEAKSSAEFQLHLLDVVGAYAF